MIPRTNAACFCFCYITITLHMPIARRNLRCTFSQAHNQPANQPSDITTMLNARQRRRRTKNVTKMMIRWRPIVVFSRKQAAVCVRAQLRLMLCCMQNVPSKTTTTRRTAHFQLVHLPNMASNRMARAFAFGKHQTGFHHFSHSNKTQQEKAFHSSS